MDNVDEEEIEDGGADNDNLINDILTSDEEEEEEKITPTRKTKLVPLDQVDDTDQETLRSLSFNERAKRTIDTKTISSSPSNNQNQITKNNNNHRKNIRRAPRGRMNSRRNEP